MCTAVRGIEIVVEDMTREITNTRVQEGERAHQEEDPEETELTINGEDEDMTPSTIKHDYIISETNLSINVNCLRLDKILLLLYAI